MRFTGAMAGHAPALSGADRMLTRLQLRKRRPNQKVTRLYRLNESLEISSVIFAPCCGIFTVSNRGMECHELYDLCFCFSGELARTCFISRIILAGI